MVVITGLLKKRHLSANGWTSERLNMGAASAVSRNVASMFAGERKFALRCYEKLTSMIKTCPVFRPGEIFEPLDAVLGSGLFEGLASARSAMSSAAVLPVAAKCSLFWMMRKNWVVSLPAGS